MPDETTFPRQQARTRRFTLGQPRDLTVSADGRRVAFLRSAAGDDPLTALWVLDVASGRERLVADPRSLTGDVDGDDLPPQERARRERVREQASGVVSYATDREVRSAAFALSGRLFRADLLTGAVQEVPTAGPAVDPRPDPTGQRLAYVAGGALYVLADGGARALVTPDGPEVVWGLAEHVAAEEMGRTRGYWWSPDGTALLVQRTDEASVRCWWVGDPAHPDREPARLRYPVAGTANAQVGLWCVEVSGRRTEVRWDRDALPYLAAVHWSSYGEPLVAVQSRDQRRVQVRTVDPASGATRLLRERTDPHWVHLVEGVPAWTGDGRLVEVVDDGEQDTRRVVVDDRPVTPPGLQVAAVLGVDDGVLFTAAEDPVELHVHRWRDDRLQRLSGEPGRHTATAGGDTVVLVATGLGFPGARHDVLAGGVRRRLVSHAARPAVEPDVRLLQVGPRRLRVGVLLPREREQGRRYPVLLDPYAGPHAQRVVASSAAWLTPQWLADQGFVVVVADGRGTPGRGPAWEREVAGDLAEPVLDDQVEALQEVGRLLPQADLDRVAVRGWSFGGYLAALAVLRRPAVFHAAVAGAPVTDWRLYDTHYSERYLGHPDAAPQAYDGSSLLRDAVRLRRPLMLVHGLADDNVVAAHTLRLSAALLEAGRPHTVLPLSGVTHMTPQETVAENLLLLQVGFLKDALASPRP